MSKQKHHSKKIVRRGSTFQDRHHLLWPRKSYNKGYLLELRRYWYCISCIPKNTLHNEIHAKIGCVPVPKEISAKSVLEQLKMLASYGAIHEDDPISKKLSLLSALFECVEAPTSKALKKQLEIVNRFNAPS